MTVLKFPTIWDYLQVVPQPPWGWKFELNNPGWKLKIRATLIAISCYLEAKFDYGYFIICSSFGSQDSTKEIQIISSKNEGVTAIFAILDFFKFFFQSLDMESHWGPKAPIRARRAQEARRAPSPPQELEGWARSAQNF